MILDASQEAAIAFAIGAHKIVLITGGAGTGKTTIIENIYKMTKCPFHLCAPTGKAAARLREATGQSAKTIHSLLGYNGTSFTAGDLSDYAIIVDESSMLSSDLLAALAIRTPAFIVLVGDNGQLHPVGAGAPFHDIIQLRPDICRELTHCYRSSEAVCHAGNQVRIGVYPGAKIESANERFEHMICGDPAAAQSMIVDMAARGDLDFEQDIVLCPKNGEIADDESYQPCTRKALNRALVAAVNEHTDGKKWKVGDRVMCTKNFAPEDVWNGTTGTIIGIDSEKEIWVKTDTPTRSEKAGDGAENTRFGKPMIAAMEHAYALSVHKSQGSQYRKVIFCCFSRDGFMMLNRALVYTAITRAQKECIVIGDQPAFVNALQRLEVKTTVLQQLAREASCQR